MNRRSTVLGCLLSLAATAPLSAQAIVSTTFNDSFIFTAGDSVARNGGDFTSNSQLFILRENTVTLTAPLLLDSGAVVPLGTTVTSFLVHFDPVWGWRHAAGSVTFDQNVLGLISTSSRLFATDAEFAVDGVTYPTWVNSPFRGLDWFTWDYALVDGAYTVQAGARGLGLDQFRIIVVPEPSTYAAALGAIVLLLVGYRRLREMRST